MSIYSKNIYTILISILLSFTLIGCESFEGISEEGGQVFNQSVNIEPEIDVATQISDNSTKPISVVPDDYHSKERQEKIKRHLSRIEKTDLEAESAVEKTDLEDAEKETLMSQKPAPSCDQNLFLENDTISNLYKTYIKKNIICKKITEPKVMQHFVMRLAENYSSQDIRIINADKNFMRLYASAVQGSSAAEKVILNKQILEYGCHLLTPTPCAIMKKSLY
ncbi:MAG: hypothetical protein ACJA1M_000965 [Alphaproteobacteria bacterium]|jgi:hypothetical protein